MKKTIALLSALLFLQACTVGGNYSTPLHLITAKEFDASAMVAMRSMPRSAGPVVELISPSSGTVDGDFRLEIAFGPSSSAAEPDMSSLKLYGNGGQLDLTARVGEYVSGDRLLMPAVKLPAGTHSLWLEIVDEAGGVTQQEIKLIAR